MHRGGEYKDLSNFFYFSSFLLTFLIPVLLLFIPWWALLVQSASCCTRKLRETTTFILQKNTKQEPKFQDAKPRVSHPLLYNRCGGDPGLNPGFGVLRCGPSFLFEL
jgi:hypothetical protein